MKVATWFMVFFVATFVLLNVLVGTYMVDFNAPVAILTFVVIEFINILIAYRLSEFALSLCVKERDLPKLERLDLEPKVALLYLTYNDAMPEVLAKLKDQQYGHYEVFVIDDSTDPHYRAIVDGSGYRVVRRSNRQGFKAGAINNWLRLYGLEYPYFIILDSDSILPEDFTERMVCYAAHPANARVSVFQSKWRIWNTASRFPAIIGAIYPLWFYSFEKLANHYDTPLIMGHNNLLRTADIVKIVGLDEDFVCEDLALSLKLLEAGYEVRYVDVISYEACPETVKSYVKRNVRWGKGTVEVLRRGTRNVSFIANFHLFMAALNYFVYLLYAVGMLTVIYGASTSIGDVGFFLGMILSGEIAGTMIAYSIFIVLTYAAIFYLIRLPLAFRLKIPLRHYVAGMLISSAMDFYMMVPLCLGILETLAGKKVVFTVTDKKAYPVSITGIFREMGLGVIFWLLIVIGVAVNPISFIFNFFWLVPWILSPLLLYIVQK